ncbi:MAG: hypothetical protein RLY86_1121 [Pseudomonadota bacterium]|jgi:signal transduction histidine kinase
MVHAAGQSAIRLLAGVLLLLPLLLGPGARAADGANAVEMAAAGQSDTGMPVLLRDVMGGVSFVGAAERLLDPNGTLTAVAAANSPDWLPSTTRLPNTYPGAIWLRLTITRPDQRENWFLNFTYPMFDHIGVWQREPGGTWAGTETGRMVPWYDRPILTHNFVFPLAEGTGPLEILVRVQTTGRLEMTSQILSDEFFFYLQKDERLLYGMFFGLLAALLLYSLFQFLSLRDPVFIWYCLALFCSLVYITSMDGLAYELFWPGQPTLNYWSLYLCAGGVHIFSVLFGREFLETRRYHPRMDRILCWSAGIYTAVVLTVPFLERGYTIGFQIGASSSLLFPPMLITAAILALRRGHKPARYFILAHSFFLAGTIIMSLRVLDVLPSGLLTLHGGRVGIAMDMLLLGVALADRVNSLRRDREMLLRLAALQKENLALAEIDRRRAVELETALTQLRDTQQQLVQREKLASLGQLVAGVAHEINTPLGVAITATSQLAHEQEEMEGALAARTMTRTALETHMRRLRDGLEIAGRNLTRAADLVQSFKQVAADRTGEQPRRIDATPYLQEVARSLEPLAKRAHAMLLVDGPENHFLMLPPGLLAQAVSNLVENAVVHAFPHEAPMLAPKRIRISVAADGPDHILITVADNGVGMSEQVREKAFEPFFTTRRNSGGTGLGLHIVHNLITGALQGKIRIESTPGLGTSFHLRLPRSIVGTASGDMPVPAEIRS